MVGDDRREPVAEIGDLPDDEEAWRAYDAKGRRLRSARWTVILGCWAFGRDGAATKRLASMTLMELVDLDATLDGLRWDIRRAVERRAAQGGQAVDDG